MASLLVFVWYMLDTLELRFDLWLANIRQKAAARKHEQHLVGGLEESFAHQNNIFAKEKFR